MLDPSVDPVFLARFIYKHFRVSIKGVCGVRDMLRLCKADFYAQFDPHSEKAPNFPPAIHVALRAAGLAIQHAQAVSDTAKVIADRKAASLAHRADVLNSMRTYCTELVWFSLYDAVLSNLQTHLAAQRSLFGNDVKHISLARNVYEDKRIKLGFVIQRAIKQARLMGKITGPCFAVDIIMNDETWGNYPLPRNTIVASCSHAVDVVQADIESIVAYENLLGDQLPSDLFELLVVYLFRDYFLSDLENHI